MTCHSIHSSKTSHWRVLAMLLCVIVCSVLIKHSVQYCRYQDKTYHEKTSHCRNQGNQLCFVVHTSSWVPCMQGPQPFLKSFVWRDTAPTGNQTYITSWSVLSPPSSYFMIKRSYWGPGCSIRSHHPGSPQGRSSWKIWLKTGCNRRSHRNTHFF